MLYMHFLSLNVDSNFIVINGKSISLVNNNSIHWAIVVTLAILYSLGNVDISYRYLSISLQSIMYTNTYLQMLAVNIYRILTK